LGRSPLLADCVEELSVCLCRSWAVFVHRSPAERTTLKQVLQRYLTEVTDKRPGKELNKAERALIERFTRDEPELRAYAMAYVSSEHFEDWRDRRLKQSRGVAKKMVEADIRQGSKRRGFGRTATAAERRQV
jgi:hypothetical protein